MKKLLTLVISAVLVIAVMPSLISGVYAISGKKSEMLPETEAVYKPNTKEAVYQEQPEPDKLIQIVDPQTEELAYLSFEAYIKGVVAAEMPALFHEEALKAQAVASRTYAVRKISLQYGKEEIETGQAYMDFDAMRAKWGENFDTYYAMISAAVESTEGEVLVYQETLIEAVFHSTSAGITENAANIWQEERPYLVSVDSKYDELAPGYITDTVFTEHEVLEKLLASFPSLSLTATDIASQMQILERTAAGYVESMQIGNQVVSGIAVREALGLRSNNFTIHQQKEQLVFTTKGYGHGAGMSQYGANYMAQDGFTYKEILAHYYTGAETMTNYAGTDVQGW